MSELIVNPLYEQVIGDLLEKQYSIVEDFFYYGHTGTP